MSKPHKHAELITAIAQGRKMQRKLDDEFWADCTADAALYRLGMNMPTRIKPEPDVVAWHNVYPKDGHPNEGLAITYKSTSAKGTLRLVFDGETGKLKSAEVV